MNDEPKNPNVSSVDPRCFGRPNEDRLYPPTIVDLHLLREFMEDHNKKLLETWERAKNPQLACGPYFYAATLTVSSVLPVHQQKAKLLKMMHTLLHGKSIAQKYQVIEEESYYVWELTKAKALHIHLLIKSKLPAKYYDIRKVKGMEGANWQELKSYDSWVNYLNKNLNDPEHIDTKAKNLLQDKLPNAVQDVPQEPQGPQIAEDLRLQ